MNNPIRDAAIEEFIGRQAVGELIAQIDPARILQ
jgi:hypothetical protein